MKVTPWEVVGKIDYDKLIKDFGVEPLQSFPKEFDHVLFRRGFVYAGRDFARIADCIKQKKPFAMMSGLMPTGKFHLGHLMVALQMVHYQKLGAKVYVAVADVEAYHQRQQSLAESREIAIDEYLLNYIALGLKPENLQFYFQSERSSDAKKSNAYYRMQQILSGHATFNEFKAVYGTTTPGKIISSTLQASDMFHPQLPEFEGKMPTVIPVGIDQDPHVRIARDMAKRSPYDLIPISSTYHKFMPGLGGGKMSSSEANSFIALTDDIETVKKKINKYAFSGGKDTVEEHRKHGGNTDIDVSYQYLKFFEDDDKKLAKIRSDYESGALLSGELKAILIEKLSSFLSLHQKKREEGRAQLKKYLKG